MSQCPETDPIEIIPGVLYYVSINSTPNETETRKYFTSDTSLCYRPFSLDFGPLELSCVYRFCTTIDRNIKEAEGNGIQYYYYSSFDGHKRSNAAFLLASYMILCQNKSPEEAYLPFSRLYPPLPPFRDASSGLSTLSLTVMDCLKGLVKARDCNFFDLNTFNNDFYEFFSKPENGELNWIVPNKILAFPSPTHTDVVTPFGVTSHCAPFFVPLFKRWHVTAVVRLNNKLYNSVSFTSRGINHYELYFDDGSVPSKEIMYKFLAIVDFETHHQPGTFAVLNLDPQHHGTTTQSSSSPLKPATPTALANRPRQRGQGKEQVQGGAVAVHCKAGLGRTGTLIACYLIKEYGFTAIEAISWLRICRPGSVVGPQQHFLLEVEPELRKMKEEELSAASSPTASPVADALARATMSRASMRTSQHTTQPRSLAAPSFDYPPSSVLSEPGLDATSGRSFHSPSGDGVPVVTEVWSRDETGEPDASGYTPLYTNTPSPGTASGSSAAAGDMSGVAASGRGMGTADAWRAEDEASELSGVQTRLVSHGWTPEPTPPHARARSLVPTRATRSGTPNSLLLGSGAGSESRPYSSDYRQQPLSRRSIRAHSQPRSMEYLPRSAAATPSELTRQLWPGDRVGSFYTAAAAPVPDPIPLVILHLTPAQCIGCQGSRRSRPARLVLTTGHPQPLSLPPPAQHQLAPPSPSPSPSPIPSPAGTPNKRPRSNTQPVISASSRQTPLGNGVGATRPRSSLSFSATGSSLADPAAAPLAFDSSTDDREIRSVAAPSPLGTQLPPLPASATARSQRQQQKGGHFRSVSATRSRTSLRTRGTSKVQSPYMPQQKPVSTAQRSRSASDSGALLSSQLEGPSTDTGLLPFQVTFQFSPSSRPLTATTIPNSNTHTLIIPNAGFTMTKNMHF